MAMKIIIPERISAKGYDFLVEQGYEVTMGVDPSVENLVRVMGEYDGLLARNARYPRQVIEEGKRLKVIGRHGTGIDNVDIKAAEELGIWVVNAPTANINAVAEQTVAFILALCCDLLAADRHTRQGDWSYRPGVCERRRELSGQTLGLVGLGRVGTLVAQKAALGLGMQVIAYDPFVKEAPGHVRLCGLEELLQTADYVSAHTPSTEATRGMMNRDAFAGMKPTAYFIDCARGDLYLEQDLYDALKEGVIAGAALDVYPEEPYPAKSKLLTLDNVLLSQHNASHSKESVDGMGYGAALGIHQILTGQKPDFPVNRPLNPRAGK